MLKQVIVNVPNSFLKRVIGYVLNYMLFLYMTWHVLRSDCCLTETLRALYLADNDLEHLPPELGQLQNLQIVSTNACSQESDMSRQIS